MDAGKAEGRRLDEAAVLVTFHFLKYLALVGALGFRVAGLQVCCGEVRPAREEADVVAEDHEALVRVEIGLELVFVELDVLLQSDAHLLGDPADGVAVGLDLKGQVLNRSVFLGKAIGFHALGVCGCVRNELTKGHSTSFKSLVKTPGVRIEDPGKRLGAPMLPGFNTADSVSKKLNCG